MDWIAKFGSQVLQPVGAVQDRVKRLFTPKAAPVPLTTITVVITFDPAPNTTKFAFDHITWIHATAHFDQLPVWVTPAVSGGGKSPVVFQLPATSTAPLFPYIQVTVAMKIKPGAGGSPGAVTTDVVGHASEGHPWPFPALPFPRFPWDNKPGHVLSLMLSAEDSQGAPHVWFDDKSISFT